MNALVLGIGSSHGDDALGWRVAARVARQTGAAVRCETLSHPTDLIDRLDGGDRIEVVDASANLPGNALVHRLCCTGDDWHRWAECAATGTHDFGLADTLRLAHALGHRLDHVSIWLLAAQRFGPLAPPSDLSRRAEAACVRQLLQELADA